MKKALILLAASALYIAAAQAAPEPGIALTPLPPVNNNGLTCFNGYAYTSGGQYRYTEHHEVKRHNGQITTSRITYVGLKGQTLATAQMNFDDWWTVPVYRMSTPATGYEEGIRHKNGQWIMFKRTPGQAHVQEKSFKIDPPMAAQTGLMRLTRGHLEALENGRNLRFKLVAPARQTTLDLRMRKSGNKPLDGQPAVELTVELDMFLVNWFIDPLKLTYNSKTNRLLEYQGTSPIPDNQGAIHSVRIIYTNQMPAAARANDAPASSCGSISSA